VIFKPGVTKRTVKVTVKGDNVDEKSEKFKLRLSNPTRAVLADKVGLGKIIDDDGPGLNVRNAAAVVERGPGQGASLTFDVTLARRARSRSR
jgi:hypothetical protein